MIYVDACTGEPVSGLPSDAERSHIPAFPDRGHIYAFSADPDDSEASRPVECWYSDSHGRG